MSKRRMLVLADSPTVTTGFSTVSKNVLRELYNTGKWEIDMVGINYYGDFDVQKFAQELSFINRLVPAHRPNSTDMYGREYTLFALAGMFPEIRPPYDVFFTIQDHFILQANSKQGGGSFAKQIKTLQKNTLKDSPENHFAWVGYWPVDGMLKKQWVEGAISHCTVPVAYTQFGKDLMVAQDPSLKGRVEVVYHGTNTKDFYPLPADEVQKFRRSSFKNINDDTFLIVNVNRNQIRKDMLRTLIAYKEFREKEPNSFLYLHCNYDDQGGNLMDMARFIDLDPESFGFPQNFREHVGLPISVVNQIYNAADVVVTTTHGEGWGLSITEAMATKTPIIAPNITSIPEIFNTQDGFDLDVARGIPVLSGKNADDFVCFGPQDNEVIRPITDVEDMVEKMLFVRAGGSQVDGIVQRAYDWATSLTWQDTNKQWVSIFEKACEVNDKLRSGNKNSYLNGRSKKAK